MNPDCGCEVIVSRTGELVGSMEPLCCCDSLMKNPNIPPLGKELTPVASDVPPLRIEPN
jgi:hypothetical protein